MKRWNLKDNDYCCDEHFPVIVNKNQLQQNWCVVCESETTIQRIIGVSNKDIFLQDKSSCGSIQQPGCKMFARSHMKINNIH